MSTRSERRALSRSLSQQSWAVVRANRYLLAFPLVGFIITLIPITALVIAAVLLGAADESSQTSAEEIVMVVVTIIVMFLIAMIGSIFTGGLVKSVLAEVRGEDSSFGRGLRAALGHSGRLARWALVQVLVGLVISAIQGDGKGGLLSNVLRNLLAATAGVMWSLVTFLVMPILMNEQTPVIASIKKSAELLKARWGLQLGGRVRISARIALLFALPAIVLLVLGVVSGLSNQWAIGIPLIALGIVLFSLALLLGQAIQGVFSTVLYLYAVDGYVAPGFSDTQLAGAVTVKA